MKYIRTKDGRISYLSREPNEEITDYEIITSKGTRTYRDESEVIKIADTIEELCDEFVIVGTNNDFYEDDVYKVYKDFIYARHAMVSLEKESHYERDFIIYGAIIRNDKDLICVAKVNEKGDLELL